MSFLIFTLALSAAAVDVQSTDATPATQAPSSVSAPASTPLNGDTPIETLAANPAAKAILNKILPNLLSHPAYEQFKAMSLRQIAPYSNGDITDEKVTEIEKELKEIPAN